MAFIQASLNLTFNANYAGCHRVCWRIQGTIPYNCTTQVNCSGNGAACPVVIPITADDSACVPIVYEGYAQACCEDINSLNGRLPFTLTFTPSSPCPGYNITCIGPVSIVSVVVTNPGSNYIPGASIPIVFSGGGGAAANAIIGNGGVDTIGGSTSISNAGVGYVNGTYNNVPAITLTGTGSGALFTVVVVGGVVVSANVVPGSNGTGYNPLDTISFAAANLGGSGAGVVITINLVNTGKVQNVVITNTGSGYTSQITGTIPPPVGGTQATFLVGMGLCPVLNLSTCGGPGAAIIGVPLNGSFTACNSSPYILPPEYSVSAGVCCSNCTSISFNKISLNQNYPATAYYTDCDTKLIVQVSLVPNASTAPVCAVNGSWFVVESNPSGTTVIDTFGSCP